MQSPPDEPDDRQIVRSVLRGDRDAFACLVRRYHGPLLLLAKSRLSRPDVAEEAVQDAFVCAYRSLHTYKPEFSFRTWLWTILLNQCRRHGSRMSQQPAQCSANGPTQLSEEFVAQSTPEFGPDLQAMRNERNQLLNELLLELPEVRADAIRLRFFGQLKYREIAEVMNSSLNAAKQRVRLGLVTIGDLLRERELTDSVFPEMR